MRKRKKVSGPHFEISQDLRARWDKMARRIGRGGVTAILTSTIENILDQLEGKGEPGKVEVGEEGDGVGEIDGGRRHISVQGRVPDESDEGGEGRVALPGGPIQRVAEEPVDLDAHWRMDE